MDDHAFDRLVRGVVARAGRRRLIRGALGALTAGLLGAFTTRASTCPGLGVRCREPESPCCGGMECHGVHCRCSGGRVECNGACCPEGHHCCGGACCPTPCCGDRCCDDCFGVIPAGSDQPPPAATLFCCPEAKPCPGPTALAGDDACCRPNETCIGNRAAATAAVGRPSAGARVAPRIAAARGGAAGRARSAAGTPAAGRWPAARGAAGARGTAATGATSGSAACRRSGSRASRWAARSAASRNGSASGRSTGPRSRSAARTGRTATVESWASTRACRSGGRAATPRPDSSGSVGSATRAEGRVDGSGRPRWPAGGERDRAASARSAHALPRLTPPAATGAGSGGGCSAGGSGGRGGSPAPAAERGSPATGRGRPPRCPAAAG